MTAEGSQVSEAEGDVLIQAPLPSGETIILRYEARELLEALIQGSPAFVQAVSDMTRGILTEVLTGRT